MLRFILVMVLLLCGAVPVEWLAKRTGNFSLANTYGVLAGILLTVMVLYGIIRRLFFPRPMAVFVVESRRAGWFRRTSNRAAGR